MTVDQVSVMNIKNSPQPSHATTVIAVKQLCQSHLNMIMAAQQTESVSSFCDRWSSFCHQLVQTMIEEKIPFTKFF